MEDLYLAVSDIDQVEIYKVVYLENILKLIPEWLWYTELGENKVQNKTREIKFETMLIFYTHYS